MRDYLVTLRREARSFFDRGISAGRAAGEIDLGPYREWSSSDRVVDNVVRLYSEFRGSVPVERDAAGTAAARAEFEAQRLRR